MHEPVHLPICLRVRPGRSRRPGANLKENHLMATKKAAAPSVIEIPETTISTLEIGVLGITPFLHNRMSEKARHELLLPKGRKNAAERASTLKHDPVEEFRASVYRLAEDDAPTLLAVMASAFKGTMMT